MIRLAVFGVAQKRCDDISRRLHGCALTWKSDQPPSDLVRDDVDAIACFGLHSPDVEALARMIDSGRHVLLATETALSIENLDVVIERAAKAGVRVLAINPDQARPSRRLVYEELRGSKFGVAGLIRLHRWQPVLSRSVDSLGLPTGVIRDLDLVLWLSQQTPNLVFAVEKPDRDGGTIQVHLGFPDGGMALVDYCDCLPEGDGYESLSVITSTGALYADDHANTQLSYRGGLAHGMRADEGVLPFVNAVRDFATSMSLGVDPRDTIASWQLLRRVAGAVRQSIDSRQALSLEGQ